MNTLYYGDNLDVLRRYIADESVDLVYLDPPFKSDQNYNVLFAERDGTQAAAQIKAFKDTWRWDQAAARTYEEVVEAGGRVSQAMQAFRTFLGDTDLLAYLAMMAPRLVELRRVLTTAGSIYLHCDPTASHYLKMLMDAVFGPATFGSEIVWKRYGAHNDAKRYGAVHDIILFYSPDSAVFHKQHQPYDASYIEQRFRFTDADGRRWAEQNLASPNPRPNLTYAFTARNGITYQPPPNGWKYTPERMSNLEAAGRLHYPLKKGGRLRLKNYLGDLPGVAVQDIWTDVGLIGGTSPERLGYPTQKPQALLERIISASSNEGDTVLDPFCGCGTRIAAAQQLNRCWVGIDITSLATTLIKHRLLDAYGDQVPNTYEVIGEPVSLPDACTLAAADPYQFQWWALGLIGARPVEQKKGADKGIDGRLFFHDEGPGGKTKQIVVSVKAGKLHAPYVRDLRGVMDREQSEMGVLVSLEPPTAKMRTEAASAGFYESAWGKHPRLQIVTVGELLDGRKLDAPPPRQTSVTFKRAPKARGTSAEQRKIFE